MISLAIIFAYYQFLSLCNCLLVEISLTNNNESKILKLICIPPSKKFNPKSNYTVLWHGSQFGNDEQKKLIDRLNIDSLMPNISINSTKRHLCYLLAETDSPYSLFLQKKRVSRASSASIPVENGICPPGYRIDQDRCFPCFPGSYTSGQDTECFLCPKDFYMDKKAADSCWPCPDGKKTVAQGADSEESCVIFDDSGHPAIVQKPPWVIIYSLIGVIILCVWIVIIILLVRYCRERGRKFANQVVKAKRKPDSKSQKPLLGTSNERDNRQSLDSSDSRDHIYAEIGDYDDLYEVPLKPSDPATYVDLDAPQLPPKRRRHSVPRMERKSGESDSHEIPIKKNEIPKTKSSEDQYEIPTRKLRDESADKLRTPKDSEDEYEIPTKKRIPISKSSEDQYEVPARKRVPASKSSDHIYEVIDSADENTYYDDVQLPDENRRSTDESDEAHVSKSSSLGFRPKTSLEKNVRKTSSEGSVSGTRIPKSDERMASIPEEKENM